MIKEITTETKTRMDNTLEDFRKKLVSIRTGRASTGLLDNIHVEYYGTPMPLNQVATVHAVDAALLARLKKRFAPLTLASIHPTTVN
jgi:ribosome recycling factor